MGEGMEQVRAMRKDTGRIKQKNVFLLVIIVIK